MSQIRRNENGRRRWGVLVALLLAAVLAAVPAGWGQDDEKMSETGGPVWPGSETDPFEPASKPAGSSKAKTRPAASAPAAPAVPAAGGMSARDLFAKCSPAVGRVDVYTSSGRRQGSGSGFMVSADGLLVTNYHVVATAAAARVTFSETDRRDVVGVVAADPKADLAILRVVGKKAAFLELAKSLPEVGTKVYGISSPIGLTNTLSDGLVSGIRDRNGVKDVQTSAPMTHGSSGGPLLSEEGKVVGVTWGGHDSGGNIGFAVAAAHVASLLEKVSSPKPLPGAGGRAVAPPREDPKAASGPGVGKTYAGIEAILREMPPELFPNRKLTGDLQRVLSAQRDQWMQEHLPGCRVRLEKVKWQKARLLSSDLVAQMVSGVQVGPRRWAAQVRAMRAGAMAPDQLPATTALLDRKPDSWTSIEGRLVGMMITETDIYVGLMDWQTPAPPKAAQAQSRPADAAARAASRPSAPKVDDRTPEQKASALMQLAENYLQVDRKDKAAEVFRKVVEEYPGTKAAAKAAAQLQKLPGAKGE